MRGEFICVVCPNGCAIEAEFTSEKPSVLLEAEGYRCKKGFAWVKQEIESPMRTIASSVPVKNGDSLMASVRTTAPIPLSKVRDVMNEIKKLFPEAPLSIGDVLLSHPAGTQTEVIVTREVASAGEGHDQL